MSTVPITIESGRQTEALEAALAEVTPLPASRHASGSISDRLAPLENSPAFAAVADLADVAMGAASFLSDLARAFARIYLRHSTR